MMSPDFVTFLLTAGVIAGLYLVFLYITKGK